MGYSTNDFSSESVGIGSEQRDEHFEYARSGGFAEVGRETATPERPNWHCKNLLFVFRKRAGLAIGPLAERGVEREPRNLEYAADSGARWRTHFVRSDRIDAAQAVEHASRS